MAWPGLPPSPGLGWPWADCLRASSISALMLTTEAMICEIPEKKAAPAGDPGHGPGGMDY